jgi:hypothetical protein
MAVCSSVPATPHTRNSISYLESTNESHPSPDFESWRAAREKLRKANKAQGIRGFSPDQMSDSLSHVESTRWTKSGRRFLEFVQEEWMDQNLEPRFSKRKGLLTGFWTL